jgi:hypothetical protein
MLIYVRGFREGAEFLMNSAHTPLDSDELELGAKVRWFLILIAGVASAGASHAQNSPLNNVAIVRVVVSWTGATDADKAAVLSDARLKLRQAGIAVLGPEEKSVVNWPTLFIGIGPGATALPLIVELTEEAYLNRDIAFRGKYTASAAYFMWYQERSKNPSPITDEERSQRMAPMLAEARENAALPLPPPQNPASWVRYGLAQNAQAESVQNIIARWKAEILDSNMTTPAGRPIKEHMMDLEVQAAMAKYQNPVSAAVVRETLKAYIDAFLNDWLAANPR